MSRAGRLCTALAAAALAPLPTAALAAFGASVQAGGTLATYAVPAPTGLACRGLTSLTTSRIVWNAVTPPAGSSVAYVVTAPGGRQTTTSATSYDLPGATLPGQYAVQTQIPSGWRSPTSTITVTLTALGLLYLCRHALSGPGSMLEVTASTTRAPILVAPAAFGGTLRAPQVAAALARGLEAGGWPVDPCPVADGGSGLLEVLLPALGGETAAVVGRRARRRDRPDRGRRDGARGAAGAALRGDGRVERGASASCCWPPTRPAPR